MWKTLYFLLCDWKCPMKRHKPRKWRLGRPQWPTSASGSAPRWTRWGAWRTTRPDGTLWRPFRSRTRVTSNKWDTALPDWLCTYLISNPKHLLLWSLCWNFMQNTPHNFDINRFSVDNGTKGVLPVTPAEWRRVGIYHRWNIQFFLNRSSINIFLVRPKLKEKSKIESPAWLFDT